MVKYKVIVAGGRDLPCNEMALKVTMKELKKISSKKNEIELFTGMARGADQIPVWLGHKHGVKVRRFPAKWTDEDGKYNPKAGFERNHQMGDEATHLIAFWDGMSRGTADMIGYAEKLGLTVKVLRYKIKRTPPRTLTPLKKVV